MMEQLKFLPKQKYFLLRIQRKDKHKRLTKLVFLKKKMKKALIIQN